jgi:hypothetical protein
MFYSINLEDYLKTNLEKQKEKYLQRSNNKIYN